MYGCIGIAVKQMGISSLEELWLIQKRGTSKAKI